MSELSHWGWGHGEKFPPADARENLGQLVQAVLGVTLDGAREPVPLSEVELAPSRLSVPASMAEYVSSSKEVRIRHTYGRAYPDLMRGFMGDFSNAPDLVAMPRNEDEIEALIAWATEAEVALIPRGGGTSVVGGVEARDLDRPSVVVSLRKMNRLISVDKESRLATVEAGATGPEFEEALRAHGLTFRHFPQSYEFSTVGGWVVTRAGGHFATVYTHIDDFVASCRMVTPAGSWTSRTLPGSGAGPSPDRAVLGSEGIYGFVTQATLRVHAPPRERSTATFLFSEFTDAVQAAKALAQSNLHPANCRLLDAREAMVNQVVFDGSHVLIVSFESESIPTDRDMDEATAICTRFNARCPDGAQHRSDGARTGDSGAAGSWRQSFFDGPYRQNILLSLGAVVDTFETACTWSAFAAMHADMKATLRATMQEVCGGGSLSMRFTHIYPDGPAPYYTFIAPGRKGEELAQWQAIKNAASDVLMKHSATITHHHAVGRNHRPWYDQQRPDLFAASLRATRSVLDPDGLMNPGVLID